jgi:5-methylcytosine-specific restriction endonuclease McrA
MNTEILRAHALVAQKKLSLADFDALILGMMAGNRRVDYYAYIASPAWKRKADAAKERARFRCQVCNRSRDEGARLEAHHRTYERLGHERPEDITVLCRDCHELYESNKPHHGDVLEVREA